MKIVTSKDFRERITGLSIQTQPFQEFLQALVITVRDKKEKCEAGFETEMLLLKNRLVSEEQEYLLAKFENDKINKNIKKHKL